MLYCDGVVVIDVVNVIDLDKSKYCNPQQKKYEKVITSQPHKKSHLTVKIKQNKKVK